MTYAGPLGRQSHKLVEYFEVGLYFTLIFIFLSNEFQIPMFELNLTWYGHNFSKKIDQTLKSRIARYISV